MFQTEGPSVHPLINIAVIILQFYLLIQNANKPVITILNLVVLLLAILAEQVLTRNFLNSLQLLKGILPLLVITAVITTIFSGPVQSTIILLRLLTGALLFSSFFSTTNPTDLTKALEKLYIPHKLAILPSLSLSLIPRTLKDAEDTIETQYFRGEIKGSFLSWIPRIIAIFVSSALYRSKFIAQSLYLRGFELGKRKKLNPDKKLGFIDLFKCFYWIGVYFIIDFFLIVSLII